MNFILEESVWMIFICASIVSSYEYCILLSNPKYEWGKEMKFNPKVLLNLANSVFIIVTYFLLFFYVSWLKLLSNHRETVICLVSSDAKFLNKTVLCGIDILTL